jgi:hypothetical protein
MTRTLRILLDSSDYSDLSDPKKLQSGMQSVLDELIQLRDEGKVKFYFTAAIVAEMAPVHPLITSPSMRRASVLKELCGRNALISTDRLLKFELSKALGINQSQETVFSDDGDWFPEGALDLFPYSPKDLQNSITEAISETPLNRKARRKLNRPGI